MQKSVGISLIVCMLVLSVGFAGCSKTEPVKEAAPLVRSQAVQADALGQNASYSGEVRGRYETQLAFQVSGKIIKRNVDLGSVVNPGDVLMEIDAKDIAQTVNISSAQVASAQSQLNLAETNLARYRKLYEQGAVSRAQLDQYENAYEVALAAVRQASAQYTQGTNQLGYSSLVADSAGVVSGVNAEAGQVVSAGAPVLTLVKDGEREIEISVPENRIDEVRSAQQMRVSFWALPDVTVEGKVREISPVADKVTRTYKVRITLTNPPAGISLGMTASVAVANSAGQQGVYIPLSAVYQTGDSPNVWVIQEDTVSLRPIKVGAFGDGKVQVVEGLQDGDVIVTAGVQKLREGQKVRI
ncbi:efflux RND transporter periplasmic adaptor subunit [Sporomusa acidovorans]|uniref:Macrolide export protein MacA n=1 Tax=Sporomusa acidovorans (strain ATCC 49682 / DSM 3132 / Mol) TaxID=1123286 RepID=A0ABZ3J0A6_SPOA4|nr:efflux RND transporter periplasmic adaptor subunit [Sporomusa acidovorans]OZC22783.1 macrolide export protein MacA [Sporomusa acidovorans DSM 3132]SDE50912.1 RND family efflux transporter, MFP subunit [Sporomusa acidovorans]